MAGWVAAISAVLLVVGAVIAAFVSIRTDIAKLEVTVHSIDLECGKNIRDIARLERLVLRAVTKVLKDNGGV